MDLFEDARVPSGAPSPAPNGDSAQRSIPVSQPDVALARCKARQSWGLSIKRYYVPGSATGEWPGRDPNELGPSDVHTVTYPFDCDDDRLRFANAFISWVTDVRDESRFSDFGEFIKRDVVRHTTVDRLDGDDRTGTTNTSALLFSVTKRERDFRKKYTIKDRHMCVDGSCRVSLAIPVATDLDKIRFAVALANGQFIDFMHEKTRVFLSSVVAFVDPEAPEAAGAAPQEMEAVQVLQEEEGSEEGEDSEDEDEMAIPQADSDSESDAQLVPEPDTEDRRTLRAISDALFDEKEAMPEGIYLRLSQALKRRRSD